MESGMRWFRRPDPGHGYFQVGGVLGSYPSFIRGLMERADAPFYVASTAMNSRFNDDDCRRLLRRPVRAKACPLYWGAKIPKNPARPYDIDETNDALGR